MRLSSHGPRFVVVEMPRFSKVCHNVLNDPATCLRVVLQAPVDLPWILTLATRDSLVLQLIIYALLILLTLLTILLLGLERRSLLAFGGHSSQSTKVDSFEVDQELVLALDVDILAGKRICIETVSRGIRVYCDLFDTRRVDLNV